MNKLRYLSMNYTMAFAMAGAFGALAQARAKVPTVVRVAAPRAEIDASPSRFESIRPKTTQVTFNPIPTYCADASLGLLALRGPVILQMEDRPNEAAFSRGAVRQAFPFSLH